MEALKCLKIMLKKKVDDTTEEKDRIVSKLTEIIKNSDNIVFFGGAGVSTESGIPDLEVLTEFLIRMLGEYLQQKRWLVMIFIKIILGIF